MGYAAAARRLNGYVATRRPGMAGLWDDLKLLVSPVPGGGSVTDSSGVTTYVDSSGNPTTDPSQAGGQDFFSPEGLSYTAGGIATATEQAVTDVAGSVWSTIPTWVKITGGVIVAGVGSMVLWSFLPHHNPPRRRRRSRARGLPNPRYRSRRRTR